jgi:DNA polymerase III delta prime subunit
MGRPGSLTTVPQALGEGDAARLAQEQEARELVGQAGGERRLARAVEALDGDQAAGSGHRGTLAHPSVDALLASHPHARAVLGAGLPPAGSPSHAYLFHGPAGAGKRAAARAFAGRCSPTARRSRGAPRAAPRRACTPT